MAMRRAFAMLLVTLFSLSLLGPVVFASDADANLPECCRRAGRHRCALIAADASAGPSLQAAQCPSFPEAKVAPVSRTVSLPGLSQAIFAGLLSHPASRPRAEALCRVSYSRAGQKRGPPTLLS